MNPLHIGISLWIVLWLLCGCVEPITIPIEEEASLLVAEGIITDAPGPYQVKLSLSSPLNQRQDNPETGAVVFIESEDGEKVRLNETKAGIYLTDSTAIRGKADKKYRLIINRKNGADYESSWETLRPSPPIDSVYFRNETHIINNLPKPGSQIYIDSHDPEGNSRFYRWTWKETWKYSAPLSSAFAYAGNLNVVLIEEKKFCFMRDSSRLIRVGTSTGNSEDIITNQPLAFITGETTRLRHRYSILVQQYVLSEEEYIFWNSIQEAAENTGTLFDRQPQSTTGNIKNINDSEEPVLGYFSASGVTEMRAYVNNIDLNFDVDVTYREQCYQNIDTIPLGPNSDIQVFQAIANGGVFYNYYIPFVNIAGFLITTPECYDCTVRGGTRQVPDFWEE
ncbi:MAG: DUF4249 domain-containing protein [Bacteroidia bacterium]